MCAHTYTHKYKHTYTHKHIEEVDIGLALDRRGVWGDSALCPLSTRHGQHSQQLSCQSADLEFVEEPFGTAEFSSEAPAAGSLNPVLETDPQESS